MKLIPNKQQQSDLQLICNVDIPQLTALAEKWNKHTTPDIQTPLALTRDAIAVFGDDSAAKATVSQLLSLRGFMRRSGHSSDETIAGLSEGLKAAEFPITNWLDRRTAFKQLLDSVVVSNAAAAIELSYDYANICNDIRLLTDIRPIFSSDGRSIEGFIVSFTMRLEYTSNDARHQISIALDKKDVTTLLSTCQRSLVKAETAKALLEHQQIPGFISGAEEGDSR